MSITGDQCRAARALLKWSQGDLKDAAKVARKTIADFENGASVPFERTLRDIKQTLEEAGVEFIPANGGGAGVRFRA